MGGQGGMWVWGKWDVFEMGKYSVGTIYYGDSRTNNIASSKLLLSNKNK